MKHFLHGSLLLTILLCMNCQHDPDSDSELLSYNDEEGRIQPVKTEADWQKKRTEIVDGMQEAMGKLPSFNDLPPFDIKIIDSVKYDLYTRYSIQFTAAENETVPAYLYVPFRTDKEKKLPAMLALHGTGDAGKQLVDGMHPETKRPTANELARRGYVVIAPDYPSMGELKDYNFETDRYESGTMKAIFNHMRCVDLLQSMEDVDPERIGVIGHSLGGHNAMFVAVFEPRLKVIVSSCGWNPFHEYYGGKIAGWTSDRYMPRLRTEYGLDPDRVPFDFYEVVAALAPRAFFSNSPLRDANFEVSGVRKAEAVASAIYRLVGAPNQLVIRYPDSEHDFPDDIREEAYQFIDQQLR